jgi:hypothetical protein
VILHSVGQGKVVVPADLTKKVRWKEDLTINNAYESE